ncbi:MAG: HD domain-containing protein [Patescibacteria group bacterium]|nr:HD domain-containing protein [Patescibacteria group bacterium]
MKILQEVKDIIKKLEKAGFEGYIVGGCVRDFLLGKEPKDWDITTNAKPEEIIKIFPDGRYENKFGTVVISEVEVTTYRIEAKYTDKRHPDAVRFAAKLEDDLARRDFTINALAMGAKEGKVIDLFGGQEDLNNKIVRAVGNSEERFSEDALRLLRAVRFATELHFEIEEKTREAIKKLSSNLKFISSERIRDEFTKIVMSEQAEWGLRLLLDLKLLSYIIPELLAGVGMEQPKHHIYTVFEHAVKSLGFCKSQKIEVRLAALLHDIAKPYARQGAGDEATFYGHNVRGAHMSRKILYRLKYSKKVVERVAHLIRHHMFVYNIGEVTERGVRRLLRKVGPENITDLIELRVADRLGSGCPKAKPYKLRHLEYMLEKVSRDPISAKMLKINGNDIMKILNIKPGPKIGLLVNALLAEVLDDPKLNEKKTLEKMVLGLAKLPDQELKAKFAVISEEKKKEDLEIRGKHYLAEED